MTPDYDYGLQKSYTLYLFFIFYFFKKREIHFGSSVSLKTAINLLYHL